jgi:hypothetical protein
MKVYFSSSLRAKKLYKKEFEKIYKIIDKLSYFHTSDFLLKADPDDYYKRKSGEDFNKFYKKLSRQLKSSDICVFEVTLHSLGIGYCVNLALEMGKPVILLFKKDSNPIFFKGIKSDKLQMHEYKSEDLEEILISALEIAKDSLDIRFTFFIDSKINDFFSWIKKTKKVPRSVWLRGLIEREMKKEGYK